jgi:hypothetical protein
MIFERRFPMFFHSILINLKLNNEKKPQRSSCERAMSGKPFVRR